MASFHERLDSTHKNAITTFEAIYVPADDLTDSGVQAIFPYLDSSIIISRAVYQEGRFPAVDILGSTSAALNPDTVGEDHFQIALSAQTVLKKAVALDRIVSLIGESELSSDDQVIYKRAKMIKNYMTQNFTVVEAQTEKKGAYVTVKDTVSDVKAILDGKVDQLQPEDLLFIGTLKDVEHLKNKPTTVAAPASNFSAPSTTPAAPSTQPQTPQAAPNQTSAPQVNGQSTPQQAPQPPQTPQ